MDVERWGQEQNSKVLELLVSTAPNAPVQHAMHRWYNDLYAQYRGDHKRVGAALVAVLHDGLRKHVWPWRER